VPLLEVAEHLFTTGNLHLRDNEEEWNAVARAMGVLPENVMLIRQVHRADVAVVARGRTGPWGRPDADVIVSDDSSAAVGVRVADCAPILLADRGRRAVAAIHAGWRGTAERAAIAGVRALAAEFGVDPRDLVAAIGPCLGPCCGEVGAEVVDTFRAAGHEASDVAAWFSPSPSGRPYLDLWRANRDQLAAAGVAPEHIHVAALCTKSHPDLFHSYRAAGQRAGRMLGAIKKREKGEGRR